MRFASRLRACNGLMFLFLLIGASASADTCLAPTRPHVPINPQAAREYADLISQDFQSYISGIQKYFRCLDSERARAFTEAQEVSQEYGKFIQLTQQ